LAVWVAAYFVASRLVDAGGTSGTILGDIVYPQLEALATVMLIWASRRASGPTRRFCWFMAASTFLGLCGDVTWAVLVLVVHSPPAPSLADAFYIGSVLAIFPALWAKFGSPLHRWRQTLDSSMVVLLIVYTAFAFVLRPQIQAGLSSDMPVTVAETFLILVAGVWAIFATLTVDRRLPFGVRLIVVGTVVQVASWLVYAYLVTVRGIEDGSWLYTGWQASWATVVAGCTALLLGVERRHGSRVWSTSTWVGPGVVTGLIVVTLADSTAIRTAPVRVLAALIGLALLLLRLQLTVRDRGRLASEMHDLAETDALTGVPNRRAFEERMRAAVRDAEVAGAPFSMLVIDVDHFKTVNDGYGHPFGDVVLVQVTRRLAGCVRPSDTLARLGGEEFGILARGVTGDLLPELAERCRRAVAATAVDVDGTSVSITVSVGGASMPEHATTSTELVRIADAAMYEAKKAGRNRIHIGPAMTPQVDIPIPDTGVLRRLEVIADRYAEPHRGIVDVAHRICRELGVTVAERRRCLAAARLRDIGMIAVPPAILAKTGRLTPTEERIMRDHARVGAELLSALPETAELAPVVAEHHERYDGRGYPLGTAGEAICIEARIIAVAEAWIGAGGSSERQTLGRVAARSGHELDPAVVMALARVVEAHTRGGQEGAHGLAA